MAEGSVSIHQSPAVPVFPDDDYREKNMDDVLQSENIFVNVSKGELAKAGDLKSAFKNLNHRQIAEDVSTADSRTGQVLKTSLADSQER